MDREEILKRVIDTIVDQIGADASEITESTSLKDDLEVDSLDLLQIVTAIEDGFDITIEDDVFGEVVTIGDAVSYIERLVA